MTGIVEGNHEFDESVAGSAFHVNTGEKIFGQVRRIIFLNKWHSWTCHIIGC